uniref:Uncharacterized protein n=1 Tax=Neobodo designis TaxID=312471 RepID=A0A7S1KWL9_NEODS
MLRSVLLMLVAAASAAVAATYPLAQTSSRASFELIDLLRNDTFLVHHVYDAPGARVRFGVRRPEGSLRTRTTVSWLGNWSRYSFDGEWNDACDTEAAPAIATPEFAVALGVSMATGAASLSPSVAPSMQEVGTISVRGVQSRRWMARSVLVNVGAVHCRATVEWVVASDWSVSRVGGTLLHFSLDGTCGEDGAYPVLLHGNVFWMVPNTASADAFRPLGTCNASAPASPAVPSAPTAEPTAAPLQTAFPMPTLPSQFSAQILTTLVERRLSYNLFETFSWGAQRARATVAYSDGARTAIVDGSSGLAYTQSGNVGFKNMDTEPVLPDGRMKTRALFDTTTSCKKEVFNIRLVGTVNDLLLRTKVGGPKYMGRVFVRDKPAKYWRATSGTHRIAWFFEDENPPAIQTPAPPTEAGAGVPAPPTTTTAPQPSGTLAPSNATANTTAGTRRQTSASSSGAGRLLRVTVSGTGTTPFFTVHPFLQRGIVTPEGAREACREFLPEAPDECTDTAAYFHHVYDFASFVEVIDEAELTVPEVCSSEGGATIAAYPAADNCPPEMSPVSIFMMMLCASLFAGILAAAAMYLRMTGKQKKETPAGDLNLS